VLEPEMLVASHNSRTSQWCLHAVTVTVRGLVRCSAISVCCLQHGTSQNQELRTQEFAIRCSTEASTSRNQEQRIKKATLIVETRLEHNGATTSGRTLWRQLGVGRIPRSWKIDEGDIVIGDLDASQSSMGVAGQD